MLKPLTAEDFASVSSGGVFSYLDDFLKDFGYLTPEALKKSFFCPKCKKILPMVTSLKLRKNYLVIYHYHTCNYHHSVFDFQDLQFTLFSEEDQIKLIFQILP